MVGITNGVLDTADVVMLGEIVVGEEIDGLKAAGFNGEIEVEAS
jgi:hypothetical protein